MLDTYHIIEWKYTQSRTREEFEYWEAKVTETEVELHIEWCPRCKVHKSFYDDGTCYSCEFQYDGGAK